MLLCSQCPQGSGADVTCTFPRHLTHPYVTSVCHPVPILPCCLCHLAASALQVLVPPCCLYNPSTSTTSVHSSSDPSAPLCPCQPCLTPLHPVQPQCLTALHPCATTVSDPPACLCPCHPNVPRASNACHLPSQCAPTAARGTCTHCGAQLAAWPRPPSACLPPSWCWSWVSDPPHWGQPPVSPAAETCRQGQPPPGWQWVLCWEGTHGIDGSVLSPVYLHDLGIMHRDVKVGGSGAGGWRMEWGGL